MPGRPVAGARAEAFIANPFAALGESSAVIDAEQFERAREVAGLTFERFVARVKRDALAYPIEVGIVIEAATSTGPASSELYLFGDDEELGSFIEAVQSRLDANLQFCAWEGYDLELLGDTPRELELLRNAHVARQTPRVLVSYADVYDLTRYARRVEQIGVDKPYYSPFIAKKQDDEGWFPENVVEGIFWTPPGQTEPVAVPLTDELKEQLKEKLEEAKRKGQSSFTLGGSISRYRSRRLSSSCRLSARHQQTSKAGNSSPLRRETPLPRAETGRAWSFAPTSRVWTTKRRVKTSWPPNART